MKMTIIDEYGNFKVEAGTLKPVESAHPVHKARIAVALPKGAWLHAPDEGHELASYAQSKATPEKVEEFQKLLKLYLTRYGQQVTGLFIKRGQLSLEINITRETLISG
jgi:hypothetical protein